MAFVTLFVPEEFLNVPTHGSIQYHPSLLPAYRGASAINWPIIKGEKETGLSIFWPDNGLDTGDVLIQKKTPISGTDTLGTVYFDRLFPMGVDAMMESVDLVKAARRRASSRTSHLRPTKAAAAPTTPGSTGASRGSRSTGSFAAAIRRLAPGARSTASSSRFSTPSRCRRRTPRASPARPARSPWSKPTASPWSAPTAASRSPACSPPTARRSTPANGRRRPTSNPKRGSRNSPRHARPCAGHPRLGCKVRRGWPGQARP